MKIIQLEKHYPGDWTGKMIDHDSYDMLINETCRVLKPDGSHLLTLVKNAIPLHLIKQAWHHIHDYNPKTDNRGTSSGAKAVQYVRKDGSLSKQTKLKREDMVTSGVIGFYDRYTRIPYCRKCSFNAHHPEAWPYLVPLFQAVSNVHEHYCPKMFAKQKALWEKTHEDFRIPGTAYTTVTVNKNYRTAVHFDGKNLDHVVSAMLMIRQGKIKGGYTVFPEYRAGISMDTGDLVMFDGQGEQHGNTPIQILTSNAQRCTLVHYFRKNMIKCGSAEQELERAKRRQRGEPLMNDVLNPKLKG